MQLYDRKHGRPVYTTCIQPLSPYKRKRSHLKVKCVTKDEHESYSLFATFVVVFVAFCVMFVRWWLGY